MLRASRPTAVNLSWAIKRIQRCIDDPDLNTPAALRGATLREAELIAAEDVWTNRQIGLNAMRLVPQGAKIVHHCNTGSLATVDYGTALGIIRTAHEQGSRSMPIWTRPVRVYRAPACRLGSCSGFGVPHTGES